MDLTQQIGAVVIAAARENEFIDDRITAVAELADTEKALFVKMFEALRQYQRGKQAALSADEVSSMFTFVYAKAAELVTDYVNRQVSQLDMAGLFDGKVPLYADEQLVGYFKKCDWPAKAAEAFLNCDPGEAEPLLALFEALKWCFRVSVHLAVTRLEERGIHF